MYRFKAKSLHFCVSGVSQSCNVKHGIIINQTDVYLIMQLKVVKVYMVEHSGGLVPLLYRAGLLTNVLASLMTTDRRSLS